MMSNGDDPDRFFYPTLTYIIDSNNLTHRGQTYTHPLVVMSEIRKDE